MHRDSNQITRTVCLMFWNLTGTGVLVAAINKGTEGLVFWTGMVAMAQGNFDRNGGVGSGNQ